MVAIPKKLRRNQSFLMMSVWLTKEGYPFEPVIDHPHPYLLIDIGLRSPVKMYFPLTPSDHRSAMNSVSDMKKFIRDRRELASRHAA